jgi:hypothetical protein
MIHSKFWRRDTKVPRHPINARADPSPFFCSPTFYFFFYCVLSPQPPRHFFVFKLFSSHFSFLFCKISNKQTHNYLFLYIAPISFPIFYFSPCAHTIFLILLYFLFPLCIFYLLSSLSLFNGYRVLHAKSGARKCFEGLYCSSQCVDICYYLRTKN